MNFYPPDVGWSAFIITISKMAFSAYCYAIGITSNLYPVTILLHYIAKKLVKVSGSRRSLLKYSIVI